LVDRVFFSKILQSSMRNIECLGFFCKSRPVLLDGMLKYELNDNRIEHKTTYRGTRDLDSDVKTSKLTPEGLIKLGCKL